MDSTASTSKQCPDVGTIIDLSARRRLLAIRGEVFALAGTMRALACIFENEDRSPAQMIGSLNEVLAIALPLGSEAALIHRSDRSEAGAATVAMLCHMVTTLVQFREGIEGMSHGAVATA